MTNRKDYQKAYNQPHKEQRRASAKAWYEAHMKEVKAYYEAHKEEIITKKKAYQKAHKEELNEYFRYYNKANLNSHGQTKNSIRHKSRYILKKSGINIPGYQIHHCFGYEDASKFIYISKALHLKIHAYLREHNIDAGKDHWMSIRDLVNESDEFMYIKC